MGGDGWMCPGSGEGGEGGGWCRAHGPRATVSSRRSPSPPVALERTRHRRSHTDEASSGGFEHSRRAPVVVGGGGGGSLSKDDSSASSQHAAPFRARWRVSASRRPRAGLRGGLEAYSDEEGLRLEAGGAGGSDLEDEEEEEEDAELEAEIAALESIRRDKLGGAGAPASARVRQARVGGRDRGTRTPPRPARGPSRRRRADPRPRGANGGVRDRALILAPTKASRARTQT